MTQAETQTEKRRQLVGVFFSLVVTAGIIVAWISFRAQHPPSQDEAPAPPAASKPVEIEPEQIYTTLPNNLACPTEGLLVEAIQHANAGERTLLEQMIVTNGGPCMVFPAGVPIRVLHVDRSAGLKLSIIRFGLVDRPGAEGMWAIDSIVVK
jgi:hypothetical protein